jgi:hypothetical protein
VQIYNNNEYGDWGIHTTALVFIEANSGGTGSGSNAIYNNLFSETNAASHPPTNGDISLQGNNWYVLNNTFINDTNAGRGGGALQADSGTGTKSYGNVLVSPSTAVNFPSNASMSASNYNVYYNVGTSVPYLYRGVSYKTLSTYTAATGLDVNSTTVNPQLSSDKPSVSSVAASLEGNMSYLCSTFRALCYDRSGASRPASGDWAAGAYQATLSAQVLNPPTSLGATVQ